jgi:hypothetical protein
MKNEEKFILLFIILLRLHVIFSTAQFIPNDVKMNSQQELEFFQKFMNNLQILNGMNGANPNQSNFLQNSGNYNFGNMNNMNNLNPTQLVTNS